ncbi:MAG: DUF624 domain-containing protein [Bacillus sp. (in: Bacteria)]|nr:DUF624 domain-containing protein [Bacillus sp. (in: firmicutes)]MCM1427803.1 DUF624 domain-containing protein [Eubacterium sp.]
MSNSPVIAFLNKLTDLILLNVLLIICCLPVVTAGAAVTAAYYVSITSIRCGDGYVVRRFFTSFKKNFRQITPVWIAIFICTLILAADMLFWYRLGSGFGKVMFIVSAVVAFLLLIWTLWIFPVFAKLEGRTRELLKNAAAFAVGYFPYTVIVLLITGAVVYANLTSLIANGIMLFVGFALVSYVKSFFFYRVFMNHIDEKYDDFDKPEEN